MTPNNKVIVFDLGGVLIDWDPRHMYRKIFDDEAEMERFLTEVATNEWNAQHDAGRRWEDGVALLSAQYPHLAGLISAYWERWDEMLAGPIEGTVAILASLRDAGYELHALTNWSTQTFPIARERYEFLDWFETIVVSGEEEAIKPDPRIYQILLERIGRRPAECIFIDDAPRNVAAASELGFTAIRFENPDQLRSELGKLGVNTQSQRELP
jgi:2-haloacid dehalogenase